MQQRRRDTLIFDDMDFLLPWFLKTIYDASAKRFYRSLLSIQHEKFYLIVLMFKETIQTLLKCKTNKQTKRNLKRLLLM